MAKDYSDKEMQALLEYYEQQSAEHEAEKEAEMGKNKHKHGGKNWGTKTEWLKPRCHETHKIMKVGNGYLFGGSCSSPRSGFDVYVGFDSSMHTHTEAYPWKTPRVEQVYFPIKDYSVPVNKQEFMDMCKWISEQLDAGKKVHLGCIGGHGRTGTVIAGVMAYRGEKDAIGWTRKNHCHKAVESDEQVKMLVKLYGVLPVKCSKTWTTSSKTSTSSGQGTLFKGTGTASSATVVSVVEDGAVELVPVTSKKCIWRVDPSHSKGKALA